MKILHVIPWLSGGGAERQLGYLSSELGRRQHQVLIAYMYEGPAPEQADGVPRRQLAARRLRDPHWLLEVLTLIRSWRPDVVQTWQLGCDIFGGIAAAVTRTPWVLREPSAHEAYDGNVKAKLRAIAGRTADAVVVNSEGGAAYWARHDHRRLIRNAVPLDEIDRARRLEFGTAPTIAFAGRLTGMKNVDVLLRAASQIAGADVVVCGSGPRREELERLAAALGTAGRVRFTGYTSDVWPIVKGATLFVSLSDFEGAPNAVLEAFAAGTPAILSDIPAHRAIADDRSAFFAPVRDADGTAAVLRDALAHPREADGRARHARRHVESLSIAAMADAYEEVYDSLVQAL